MKKVKWQMKENFVFPSAIGLPTDAEEVKVTPRFTLEKVDDRPKLTGIYHLAVNVKLDTENGIEPKGNELILIDDLDIDDNTGYFEYAVPFNIDFPPEANDPIGIQTANPHYEVDKNGILSIIWDVECSYKEVFLRQPATSELAEQQALESSSREVEATVAKQEEESEKSSKKLLAKIRKKKEEAPSEQEASNEKADDSVEATVNQVPSNEQSTASQTAAASSEDNAAQKSVQSAAVDEGQEFVKNKSKIVVETASFSEGDEVLSFLSELDDEISTTAFNLNNILVQAKS